MSYRQPGVTVTEIFANALPALATFSLPNVIVGPVFSVFTNASAGVGSYVGSSVNLSYPSFPSGSFVDTRALDPTDLVSYPVAVNFKNTVIDIINGTAGVVLTGQLTKFTDATSSIFAGVVAGDIIHIPSGTNAGNYTVRAVVDNNTLTTEQLLIGADTAITYSIYRNIGLDGSLLALTSSQFTVTDVHVNVHAGLTADSGTFTGKMIISAEALISYRALRIEKSADIFEYTSTVDLQADFGSTQIVPESPAVFGAFLALNNSVTPTNIVALDRNYLTDELLAYDDAFEVLKRSDVYAISVMTQNTAVHSALKTHVDGLSTADQKLERVGIINRQIVLTAQVDGPFTNGSTDGVTGTVLSSSGATFITDGVVPGDFVQITAGIHAGTYLINSVDAQTQLTLDTAVALTQTNLNFYTFRNLTRNEQAETIAAYASSLADRRMVLTWPDVVNIPVKNTVRQLPGYFLNCAVGALTTGLPTQQGLTNLSMAVYSGVVHSTRYFSNDQLNILAGGGVMVFVQDVLNQTPLFIRHQLTTDTSAVVFQEYSVTKNLDFIAKFIRANHKQFIGQYNIVDGTFDDLKTNAKGIVKFFTEATKRPKIGGVLTSGSLTSITQSQTQLDGIVETWTVNLPIPLNNLDITVVVSE